MNTEPNGERETDLALAKKIAEDARYQSDPQSWALGVLAAALASRPAEPAVEPRAAGGGWSLTFSDPRDFCRFASILIGAAYQAPEEALKRFENGSLWGESTHGKVAAASPQPGAPSRAETFSADGRWIFVGDSEHDVKLTLDGDFESDAQRAAYARSIADRLNAATPQPGAETAVIREALEELEFAVLGRSQLPIPENALRVVRAKHRIIALSTPTVPAVPQWPSASKIKTIADELPRMPWEQWYQAFARRVLDEAREDDAAQGLSDEARDAARYRFLRDHRTYSDDGDGFVNMPFDCMWHWDDPRSFDRRPGDPGVYNRMTPEERASALNAAIDASLAAAGRPR